MGICGEVALTLTEAKKIVGSIGFPRKMPGTSYGLSAHACKAGATLAKIPGSICSGCYALRDQMSWPNAQIAYARRLQAISRPEWVEAMVRMLTHLHATPIRRIDMGLRPGPKLRRLGSRHRMNPMGYHRWHDSGDLQSVEHLEKIIEVARRTPLIRHWLPTRELAMLRACGKPIPSNLTIRVSATMIDGRSPVGWLGSTVHRFEPPSGAHECPAPRQNHECGSCRACWSRDIALVSYGLH